MRVTAFKVTGSRFAVFMSLWLTDKSQWFQCEPLPSDIWQFTVKNEFLPIARQAATVAAEMSPSELDDELLDLIDAPQEAA